MADAFYNKLPAQVNPNLRLEVTNFAHHYHKLGSRLEVNIGGRPLGFQQRSPAKPVLSGIGFCRSGVAPRTLALAVTGASAARPTKRCSNRNGCGVSYRY
jgi:hypothetical protein